MDMVIFEENKPLVLEGLEQGEFDYIEAASEVFETEFFRYINARQILQSLAESYPTPRRKQEVPLWFYIASNLSMRLHGVHSFHAFPMIVRAGGMLNAFGPDAGRKIKHPDSQDLTLACKGFIDFRISNAISWGHLKRRWLHETERFPGNVGATAAARCRFVGRGPVSA